MGGVTTAPPCAACAARGEVTTVNDFYSPGRGAADALGLRQLDGDLFACTTCGTRYRRTIQYGEVFEDHDTYYFRRLTPGSPGGCAKCSSPDAAVAWEAARSRHLHTFVDESHYDVALTACTCGSPFAKVFTERIDWVNGEDDQTTMLLPLTEAEATALRQCPLADLRDRLHALGHGRRFVLRTFARGADLATVWRDGGFWIGPHD